MEDTVPLSLLQGMPNGLAEALHSLSAIWSRQNEHWIVGGSCALLVQGVELDGPPRDIDVYADLPTAKSLDMTSPGERLSQQRVDSSGNYVSLLSHYQVQGFQIELVGGFEILAAGAMYRLEVDQILLAYTDRLIMNNNHILHLMPLSHELMFNILRDRPDRYEKIAEVMKRHPEKHIPLLKTLLDRNVWVPEQLNKLKRLLPWSEWYGK